MQVTCEELVRGSIYSRKGATANDDCPHVAKFKVSPRDGLVEHVCGIHVRRFRLFNEGLWRTDDFLKRPRRKPFYPIEALED